MSFSNTRLAKPSRIKLRRRLIGRRAGSPGPQQLSNPALEQPTPSIRLPSLEEIADVRNLRGVFEYLKHEAGQAPGLDGLRYHNLGASEIWDVLREARRRILANEYQPGPTRRVPIPKTSGKRRILQLAGIIDRVIAKAVQFAIDPLVDPWFLPESHGFRPDRSTWTFLADLERHIIIEGRTVLINDDVKSAFDSLPVQAVVNGFNKLLGAGPVTNLIEVILRGANPHRAIGIDQGCSLSPLGLNIFMHFFHDLPLVTSQRTPFWSRYADNLIYACQDMPEAYQLHDLIKSLLHANGISLKSEEEGTINPIIDLTKGDSTEILGFKISLVNNSIQYEIANTVWDDLTKKLEKVHTMNNPPFMARSTIQGLLNGLGPIFENANTHSLLRRIRHIANTCGHREIASNPEMLSLWEKSWTRWNTYRAKTRATHEAAYGECGVRRRQG